MLNAYHFAAGTGIGYECIDPVQGPYAKLAGPVWAPFCLLNFLKHS